jgi:hypothetical protein
MDIIQNWKKLTRWAYNTSHIQFFWNTYSTAEEFYTHLYLYWDEEFGPTFGMDHRGHKNPETTWIIPRGLSYEEFYKLFGEQYRKWDRVEVPKGKIFFWKIKE